LKVGKFFLNISGIVWRTAPKLSVLIDIMEGQVLVVKNLWHRYSVGKG